MLALRRAACAATATAALVLAPAGIAAAAQPQPHSVGEAQTIYGDTGPTLCGIQCEAPAPDQGDADAAAGAVEWGLPTIFVIGLIVLF